jgi:hypothetical protein
VTTAAPIRFAVLGDPATLETWQRRCLEELRRVPEVVFVEERASSHLDGQNLDFILSWIDPPSELLAAARYGVWKYQFGDWVRYRGGPAGFWEVHDSSSVSAATLVRLTDDADEVVVLREGYLRTNTLSAAKNRRQLQECCVRWAAQLALDIRNGAVSQFAAEPRRTSAPVRAAPSAAQRLQHQCRIVGRMAAAAWRDLFRHDQWNIGVVEQPITEFLEGQARAATRWFPEPRPGEIVADPFGVVRDGHLTVLCEYLSFADNRGVIVAMEPNSATASRRVPVGIGPVPAVHLSYPQMLQVEGRTFCVPETHEARELALYELERFPDRWRRIATLLTDTVVVDATVFEHGGLWWIAGSEAAPKGASCELHLWHAEELTGPWQIHPGNPVKVDVRSARPGGTVFIRDGVLYRPAQDCSRTYGGRIVINRVITLTPTTFAEEFAAAVDPEAAGPYPCGLHTLSAVGNVTLIDGKRIRFVPAQFARTLRSWLNRLRRRRGSSGLLTSG